MSLLVYERQTAGHRENYALTVARILGGQVVLGKQAATVRSALAANGLVITTLESSPALYLFIALLRSLARKPTTLIATRSHVKVRRGVARAAARSLAYATLRRLPPVQLLTISPPAGRDDARMRFIEDIEFWDLPAGTLSNPPRTALSERVAQLRKARRILLVLGTIEVSKGIGFLTEVMRLAPQLKEQYAIVACGEVIEPSRAAAHLLREHAAIWEDRYLSRDEMLSLYPEADLIWCCYHPEYDVSSGIFGRAVQFGRPTVVRAGSMIARLQARLGRGLALDYGDAAAAARALAVADTAPGCALSRYDAGSAALRDLIAAHHRAAANL